MKRVYTRFKNWLLEVEIPPEPVPEPPPKPVRHYIRDEKLLGVLTLWYEFNEERTESRAMLKKVKFKELLSISLIGVDDIPSGEWFFKVGSSAVAYITDTEDD